MYLALTSLQVTANLPSFDNFKGCYHTQSTLRCHSFPPFVTIPFRQSLDIFLSHHGSFACGSTFGRHFHRVHPRKDRLSLRILNNGGEAGVKSVRASHEVSAAIAFISVRKIP